MKFRRISYIVGHQFFPALINDEFDALSDDDKRDVQSFIKSLTLPDNLSHHWSHEPDSESRYARCEITMAKGLVSEISLMLEEKDGAQTP